MIVLDSAAMGRPARSDIRIFAAIDFKKEFMMFLRMNRRVCSALSVLLLSSTSFSPAVFADSVSAEPGAKTSSAAPKLAAGAVSTTKTARHLAASDDSIEAFGVHAWSLRIEEGPGALRDTVAEGLDADGNVLGRVHIGSGQGGEPSLYVESPYLPGAVTITREVRDKAWLDALTADLERQAWTQAAPMKASGEPLDPSLCAIKTAVAAAAFTSAVAACEPTPAAALCATAIVTLAAAIDDMRRACGGSGSGGTFCTPGTAAPCTCSYRDCDDNIILGIKICNPAGSAYSSCIGCPTSAPDCPDPNYCSPVGTVDSSNWCAENECGGSPGTRTCDQWNSWNACTCGQDPPTNECDWEGQTASGACSHLNCPLGSTATKVCVADPIDSNLTWSECFCDELGGGGNEVEDPLIDNQDPWADDGCEFGPDACTTEVSGRRLCRRCSVTDLGTGTCLLWYPWAPC